MRWSTPPKVIGRCAGEVLRRDRAQGRLGAERGPPVRVPRVDLPVELLLDVLQVVLGQQPGRGGEVVPDLLHLVRREVREEQRFLQAGEHGGPLVAQPPVVVRRRVPVVHVPRRVRAAAHTLVLAAADGARREQPRESTGTP